MRWCRDTTGAITVTSQPGQGTTFRVYLPAAAAAASVPPAPVQVPLRGEGQHILYLDDEESLVFLAVRMLERLGYQVSGFSPRGGCDEAFRENPDRFDLVITDLNMPGASGLQVAEEILKLRPDVPVVLCSGHVSGRAAAASSQRRNTRSALQAEHHGRIQRSHPPRRLPSQLTSTSMEPGRARCG